MRATGQALARRTQQIRTLTEVSRALTDAVSLDQVFQLAVDCAANLMTAEQVLLLLVDDEGHLALRASHGLDAALEGRALGPFDECVVGRLAGLLARPEDAFLGVPLVVAGSIQGILVVVRGTASTDADHDEWLLSAVADQAAVALERERLHHLGERRERLIGIVSHDLRNPLSTILIAAHRLGQRKSLDPKDAELARKITSSASQAARLVEELLDLTRSRLGGGIPIAPRTCDLAEVCAQILGEMELTHPDRPLHLDLHGDLTGLWDRDRLYQLLVNLVSNAVDHGEPRSPIELRGARHGSEIVIEVANRGEPIPAPMLRVIFDAFRQARFARPARGHGLGLGLFIAQQIAVSHGGSIAATSSARDGTAFRLRLPRGTAVSLMTAP